MSLLRRFTNFIHDHDLFQSKDHLLLAVSGGVDSVVLCELCARAGFNFQIAHCNFQLRGAESDRDEGFVASLAEKYKTEIFIKKFDVENYAAQHKVSIQVAARVLRYEWFNQLVKQARDTGCEETAGVRQKPDQTNPVSPRACYIVTAHHANDNIETFLMNIFKGTGIKGLRGMLPKKDKLVRPLLFAMKEEIVSFAHDNGLAFEEDSSNSSDKYSRNYFRNQVIPSIQKVFPQVEENLLHDIERFAEIEMLYQQAVVMHKKRLMEYRGNEIQIPVLKLMKSEPLKTILYEIIKEYGFTAHQGEEVLDLINSKSGKYISSPTHKIIKNRNWIIIAPHSTHGVSLVIITEKDRETEFEQGKLKIEQYSDSNFKPSADQNIAMLDAAAVTFPLLLRKWREGDYFYPLGMQKKKKLSRFFIDQKMSLTEKEQAWVIESDKRIIWVVGKRIDDRFKITNRTASILMVHFNRS